MHDQDIVGLYVSMPPEGVSAELSTFFPPDLPVKFSRRRFLPWYFEVVNMANSFRYFKQ